MIILTSVLASDLFFQVYFRSGEVGLANNGISFGWLPGLGWLVPGLIYLFFVVWFIKKMIEDGYSLGLFAVVLGGLGNLIPRIFSGGVWDYIWLPLVPFRFNLSDVLITMGVIYYIFEGNLLPARRRVY